MLKSKRAVELISNYQVVIDYEKDMVASMKDILPNSFKTIKKEIKVFEIIDKYPEELGFVLSSKTYDDYINTFITLGVEKEDVKPTLSEKQFKILREHFKDRVV